MHEKINEPVDIIIKFAGRKISPVSFFWRGQTYQNLKVNLVHHSGVGEDKIYYFSVSDTTNWFRLAFYTRDLSWKLEELYYDG